MSAFHLALLHKLQAHSSGTHKNQWIRAKQYHMGKKGHGGVLLAWVRWADVHLQVQEYDRLHTTTTPEECHMPNVLNAARSFT
mmetsp:Transcript_16300/g.35245  ORF Transcript_16300/g.35245 Transcript_16300/m.35245 type:complete len:83 (+) Transcript_16300:369-617(+)